jgi:tetratricopeptide (TPR) repeat protein
MVLNFGLFTTLLRRVGKDAAMADKIRKYGNGLFTKNNLRGALQAYNQAICLAPKVPFSNLKSSGGPEDVNPNTCLAMCFANRSAVFVRENRYTEALSDIDQALLLGYPKKLSKKLFVRKARIYLTLEHYAGAVACLKKEGARVF